MIKLAAAHVTGFYLPHKIISFHPTAILFARRLFEIHQGDQQVIRVIGLLLILFSLTSCVTTIEGGTSTDVDPERALASHIQLGLSYLRAGNRESAQLHLNKAMEYDKRSPGANDGMALLYQLEGEMDLAEDYFKKAIRYDRKFSRARNNYGNFLYQQGRYEEAYEQFDDASKDISYESRGVALVNLGRTALKLGDTVKAEAAFRHALSLDPGLTPAIAELAEIAFNNQQYADAKTYIDQYGKLTRHSARTLWLGIRIEQMFGNRDKAASYGMQLKSLHPYSKENLEYKQATEDDSRQ